VTGLYNRMKQTAADIAAHISEPGSLTAAENMLGTLTGEKGYVFGQDISVRRYIPNIVTGFVLSSFRQLADALGRGDNELAADIAEAVQALPDEDLLPDKGIRADFNARCIRRLNDKYGRRILPEI